MCHRRVGSAALRLLLPLLLTICLLIVASGPPFTAAVNGQPHTSHRGGGLVIGVPFENLNSDDDGAVHVLYATDGNLSEEGSQFWHQASDGIPSIPRPLTALARPWPAATLTAITRRTWR